MFSDLMNDGHGFGANDSEYRGCRFSAIAITSAIFDYNLSICYTYVNLNIGFVLIIAIKYELYSSEVVNYFLRS